MVMPCLYKDGPKIETKNKSSSGRSKSPGELVKVVC